VDTGYQFRPDFPERRDQLTLVSEIREDSKHREAVVIEAADHQEAAEQLALVLTTHGLQRMTARVLATLLFTEQPTMTMGELAERLQASPGAISGAVKMLTSVGLVERVPAPASRRDHYRLRDNAWAVLYTNQNEVITAMQEAAEAGIAATANDSLAHRRLTQMRDFYAFLLQESRAAGPLATALDSPTMWRRSTAATKTPRTARLQADGSISAR
jgi:DNA-binding transcriptional regulator GbsR (MarR family)